MNQKQASEALKSDWNRQRNPETLCVRRRGVEWRRGRRRKKVRESQTSSAFDSTVVGLLWKPAGVLLSLRLPLSPTAGWDKERQTQKRRVGEVFTSAGVSVTVCMKGSHSEEKMTLLSLACFSSCRICWKLLHSVISGKRCCCKSRIDFQSIWPVSCQKSCVLTFPPWCIRAFSSQLESQDYFYCPCLFANTTFTLFLFA